jgi:hypothetical protein
MNGSDKAIPFNDMRVARAISNIFFSLSIGTIDLSNTVNTCGVGEETRLSGSKTCTA